MSGKSVWVEQLGAASSQSSALGVARAKDLLQKVLPGTLAKLKVARDDQALDGALTQPFTEQLGVASGRYGLPRKERLAPALMGLYAKWQVSHYWGYDYRAQANTWIEHKLMPLPMNERQKALLLTLLYEAARRLPGR